MVELTTTLDDERTKRSAQERFGPTVLDGLFLLIALLAAILRFADLAGLPLSPAEAEAALQVWRFWQPESVATPSYPFSPLYFSLTVPLLAILGDGDAVMRLIPALAGTIFVLLPWFWRRWLGGGGALVASLLLAVSPTTAVLARTASGDALALTAIFLLLVAGIRFLAGRRRIWLFIASGAVGAGLTSAPLFYNGLATLALAWLVQSRLGPAMFAGSSPNGQEGQGWRPLLAFGGSLFLVLASFFFLHPAGLGEAAMLAGRWLGQFALPDGIRSVLSAVLALGRYEMITVTLGLAAILWATWRGYPIPVFLVYWFAAGLLLTLFQPGVMSNVPLLALPAYLLLGFMSGAPFRQMAGRLAWAVWLLFVVLGAIIYFNVARYIRVITYNADDVGYALLALIAFAVLLIAVNYIRSWDWLATVQGTIAGLLTLFVIFNWGTAWWLAHEAANDPRTRWVTVGTDENVRLLSEVIEEISWQELGAAKDVDLLVALESPLLRWYLRDFVNLQIGKTVPPGAQQGIIITGTAEQEPGPNYIGSDFSLLRREASAPAPTLLDATLRWWLFRESAQPLQKESVILWTRAPVAAGG